MFEKEWNEWKWFFKGCAQITPIVLGGFSGYFWGEAFSRYFKLNFNETLICGTLSTLFGGLLLGSVIWLVKYLSRKKLCALVSVGEPIKDKCTASILLWNPALFRDVYSGDLGEFGFCFTTNFDATIRKISVNRIKRSDSSDFSSIPGTTKNTEKIIMNVLPNKSLVEFEFLISKKTCNIENSIIILPSGIKTYSCFKKPPIFRLLFDRTVINITVLKYNILTQLINWFCSCAAILSAVFTLIAMIVSLSNYSLIDFFTSMFLGIVMVWFFIFLLGANGDVVPPFVMKHIKSEAGAKYRKKTKKGLLTSPFIF